MDQKPLVSIIIPVLNSQKTLERCLCSVLNQSYSNTEIIVVDGGSQDKTVSIADELGSQVIESKEPSMTKQTNLGVLESKGKYVYRVDSDVILPPKIVEECINKCEFERYDGVCVFWLPDPSISFWAKVRRLEKESYIKYPNYVGSVKYDKNILGARFLRRDVLDEVGGFDEKIPTFGEDYALYNKLVKTDFQFAVIKSREKHIGEPENIMDVVKKNFKYGTDLIFFLDNQEEGENQFSPLGRKYLAGAFRKSLKNSIFLFFGLSIYLFTVYASTATGMVYCKLKEKK